MNKFQEKQAVEQIPFLLDEQLFLSYINSYKRLKFETVAEAKKLLFSLTGVQQESYAEFMSRVWQQGQETLTQFMCALQHMAAILDLPEGLVKSQFLNGIPHNVSAEIRIVETPETACGDICKMANRILTFKPKSAEDVAAIHGDLDNTIKQLQEEVNALKMASPKNKLCFTCHKEGHIARNCRNKRNYGDFTCYHCGRSVIIINLKSIIWD